MTPANAPTAYFRPRWTEADRLATLRDYGVLDTSREVEFDEITEIAAIVCDAPIAVVNLIEGNRQFFKAEIGLGVRETPLDVSICAHAILQKDLFVVPDTTKDARFSGNPLVTGDPHLRFYAGALLETPEGLPLGTVCVLDYQPRPQGLSQKQARTLRALARQVMTLLELRRALSSRERHEAELANSERNFRVLADAMPQMVWSTRADGFHDYYNRRWYEFTGVPIGSTDGEGWSGMFHPDDQAQAWDRWQHSLETGQEYEVEYRLRHHSGEYRWVLGRALPVRDEHGTITRWFGTCTDIHEQKIARDLLRASQERLDLALNASGSVGTWVWDIRNDRVVADGRFARLFGVDSQRATAGVPISEFLSGIHPDDRERVEAAVADVLERGGNYEFEYRVVRPSDGLMHWVNARGRCEKDESGKPLRFPGAIVDITARKEAEADAAARANLVETLLATAPVAVWFTDDVQVQRVMRNAHAAEIMRLPPASTAALGSTDQNAISHVCMRYQGEIACPEQLPLQRAVRGEDVRDEEYELVFKDGSPPVTLLSSASPLRDERGTITGAVAVSLNITNRKRSEEALELLARELSHRIKNVFAVVGGLVALSARGHPEAKPFADALRERLTALAQAHEYVQPHHPQGSADGVDETVQGLMAKLLEPYLQKDQERIMIRGADAAIGSKSATALALIMHEQATNAVKYGALSSEAGRVILTGHQDGDVYRLIWEETGGPPVAGPPDRKGFGTLLAARSVTGQLGGEITHEWATEGLTMRLCLPIDTLSQ